MNNLLKWGLGLAALGVTVYVVGRAWKSSQKSNKALATDANEQATFVDDVNI
jgi:hypothetical protein